MELGPRGGTIFAGGGGRLIGRYSARGEEGEGQKVAQDRAPSVADDRSGVVAESSGGDAAEPDRAEHEMGMAKAVIGAPAEDRRHKQEQRARPDRDAGKDVILERREQDPIDIGDCRKNVRPSHRQEEGSDRRGDFARVEAIANEGERMLFVQR